MMKKFDVHVCLVSGQPTPNYIPILDNDFRPEEVILLVTKEMENQARMLKEVLKERCPNVRIHQLTVENPYNVAAIQEPLLEKIAEIGKDSIALNVTGGTKLMAIEAYGLINGLGYKSFYFIPEENSVFVLNSHEKIPLAPPKLLIKDYLKLHGYGVVSAMDKGHGCLLNQSELTQELILMSDDRKNALSHLNGLIGNSKALNFDASDKQYHYYAFEQLISLLEKHELLTINDDWQIAFPSHDKRKYVNGGWFEEHVFSFVSQLEDLQDCLLDVQIDHAWKMEVQKNQMDVIYMRNNTLHMIECKTVNFDSKNNKQALEQGMNALYKLEALKKIGGLQCKAQFASYRKLTSPMRDRAKASNISVVEDRDLQGLKKHLENWDK